MNSASGEPKHASNRSIAIGIALVGAALALAAAIVAVFAFEQHGLDGVFAVVLAALVVWISASVALVVTAQMSGGQQAVVGMMLAIMVRTFPPLAVGLAANAMQGRLAAAGLFGYIVALYLVGLVIETCIAVKLLSTRSRVPH